MGDWPVTVNTLLFSWASCPAALIMELVVVVGGKEIVHAFQWIGFLNERAN